MEELVKDGDHKAALETAERTKGQVLINLLAEKNIGKNRLETELVRQNKDYLI